MAVFKLFNLTRSAESFLPFKTPPERFQILLFLVVLYPFLASESISIGGAGERTWSYQTGIRFFISYYRIGLFEREEKTSLEYILKFLLHTVFGTLKICLSMEIKFSGKNFASGLKVQRTLEHL